MAKVTLNGTTGLTAYKADNSTVEVQYTPAQLVGISPSVFKSASPFIISSGLEVNATTYPSYLRFNGGAEFPLVGFDAPFVTSSSESVSQGDTIHPFPSGIQAGDILVMIQYNHMRTGPGYGPTYGDGWGDGFTPATGGVAPNITRQYGHNVGGNYSIVDTYLSYKVATGSENGATVGGFQIVNNPFGTNNGWRRLMVFRPTYNVASVQQQTVYSSTGLSGSEYSYSHTHINSLTSSKSCAKILISFHMAYLNVVGPSVSGSVSSLGNIETNNGNYAAAFAHTGSVTLGATDSSVTLTAQTTNSPDVLHSWLLELLP